MKPESSTNSWRRGWFKSEPVKLRHCVLPASGETVRGKALVFRSPKRMFSVRAHHPAEPSDLSWTVLFPELVTAKHNTLVSKVDRDSRVPSTVLFQAQDTCNNPTRVHTIRAFDESSPTPSFVESALQPKGLSTAPDEHGMSRPSLFGRLFQRFSPWTPQPQPSKLSPHRVHGTEFLLQLPYRESRYHSTRSSLAASEAMPALWRAPVAKSVKSCNPN